MRLSLIVLFVFVIGLALANPQKRDRDDDRRRDRNRDEDRDRGSSRDRDRKRGRGPKGGLKCLKPLVKSCDLTEYCEDPDEDGSYRPPLIINKEKINNGECPDVDDDMRDIDIEEEEDDSCGDCPYCDSRDSVDFCVICVVKNDDRDPIVKKVKEVSVDFACEANWMGGKRKSRRCEDANNLIVDVCETDCR